MKFLKLLFCLVLLTTEAHAYQSTINTTQPVQGAPLTSAPVRNNFVAAYNDINNIYGLIAPFSPVGWPSTGNLVVSTSTNAPNGLAPVNGLCAKGAGGVWTTGACGGAGGISAQSIISSGATNVAATTGIFIGWNSSSVSTKMQTIPASIGALGMIVVKDIYGSAGAFPITVLPATGSIIGTAVINSNWGSVTLIDTSLGWLVI